VARFHIDQNAPGLALAALLRQAGHDAVTARDLQMATALDAEHLVVAARDQRILVSRDKDYLELHAGWHLWAADWQVRPRREHAGILIIDSHWDAATAAHEIILFLSRHAYMANRLYRYEPGHGWQSSPYP
jgi:hypothetical protein